jgi:hypothetical protein
MSVVAAFFRGAANFFQVSHTYEDFDDLSLSIGHDESKERKVGRFSLSYTTYSDTNLVA